MRTVRLLVVALLVLVQLDLPKGSGAQTRTKRPAAQQVAADRAWPEFFNAFRDAVHKRDRGALKPMLVRDIYFSAGGGDENHAADMRDEAFRYWDESHGRGWRAFDRTLAKGAAPTARWWGTKDENGKERPGRIAPPAANLRRNTYGPNPKIEWLAFFEFHNDGHWYCISFSECCD